MQLSTAVIMGFAAQCAPDVAPSTIAAIVHTESAGRQFALNVNKLRRQPARQSNAADAARVAQFYIARGHSVDLGLGQINSRNMARLGLNWRTVFDPCTNIAAAGKVLSGNYAKVRFGMFPQAALRAALSMYNTGSQSRGFHNGYVGRVVGNAGVSSGVIPAVINAGSPATSASVDASASPTGSALLAALVEENTSVSGQQQAAPLSPPPAWDVFATAEYERARLAEKGEGR